MYKKLRLPNFKNLFLAVIPSFGARPEHHETQVNVTRRRHGGGAMRPRIVRKDKIAELHLYGNKLARKAFRGEMTKKS